MWLCAACGLAQLVTDPTLPEEPLGREPAALVAQAADAVERVAACGLLAGRLTVAEYGSPHGGSWLELLTGRGLTPVDRDGRADVVVDCFGLMHARDQAQAIAERADRVGDGGILLLQFHSLETIIGQGQWNSLRHGHHAYYSTTALTTMLSGVGFAPDRAWTFDLYGGTVLLAATRHTGAGATGPSVRALLASERRTGVRDPAALLGLQHHAEAHASALREWLVAQRIAGRTVAGYGAASRAVTLVLGAGADRMLLRGVADASPAKHGLRMPGTNVPIVRPSELVAQRPDDVLLFVPDLLDEVRSSLPEVEAGGGRWVDADTLRP
jgi:hypothetical protein